MTYCEAHLRDKDEFVFLKQASTGVDVYRVGDEVYEVVYSSFDVLGGFGSLDCFTKHNTEGLNRANTRLRDCEVNDHKGNS